jgi:DNA-binding NarL/FixJ family response regulator
MAASNDPKPTGLLLSRDLIFTSKVAGTAKALGYHVAVAGSAEAATSLIEQTRPKVVFVDLAAGDFVGPGALSDYKRRAPAETTFIAFGSHVDTESLTAAREAGCDLVLPRSRFTAELPDIIRRSFERD